MGGQTIYVRFFLDRRQFADAGRSGRDEGGGFPRGVP